MWYVKKKQKKAKMFSLPCDELRNVPSGLSTMYGVQMHRAQSTEHRVSPAQPSAQQQEATKRMDAKGRKNAAMLSYHIISRRNTAEDARI